MANEACSVPVPYEQNNNLDLPNISGEWTSDNIEVHIYFYCLKLPCSYVFLILYFDQNR